MTLLKFQNAKGHDVWVDPDAILAVIPVYKMQSVLHASGEAVRVPSNKQEEDLAGLVTMKETIIIQGKPWTIVQLLEDTAAAVEQPSH